MKRTEANPTLEPAMAVRGQQQARPSSSVARQNPTTSPRPAMRLTKLQETCGRITEIAQELGPEAKLPTVLQLRDRLGVSVATLNAALSELETQRIIRRKHGVGIYVSPRIRQRNVALVCDPSFFRAPGASPFWNLLVDKARRRAADAEEAISLHFAVDSLDVAEPFSGAALLNDGLSDDIAAGRVDGILGVGIVQSVVDWVERQRVPLVSFAAPGACMVALNSEEHIRIAVDQLVMQGCRRIALWAPVSPYRINGSRNEVAGSASVDDRRAVMFHEHLVEHGLAFNRALVRDNRHLIVPGEYHTESHQEQGFRTAHEVFGPGADPSTRPDGIVSTDDMLTVGALTALHKLGVSVGRDVQIATHANAGSPALLGWEDELTVIEVDPSEIVSLMFAQLEACMDGRPPAERIALAHHRLRTPKAPATVRATAAT